MAKPTTVPVWATDANYPAGAEPEAGTPTKVAPTSGKIETGWRPDEVPPAQEWNHWRNLVGLWCGYLDEGVLEGAITVDGDLEVTGDTYHSDRTVMFTFGQAASPPSSTPPTFQAFGTNAFCWSLPATANLLLRYLDFFKVGDRIKSITIHGNSSQAGVTEVWLQTYDAAVQFTGTEMNASGGYDTTGSRTFDMIDPVPLELSQVFFVKITSGTDDIELTHITVTYDRPKPP